MATSSTSTSTYEKTCFILGSSGETGKQLLSIFCENDKFDKIIALNRKPLLEFSHSKFEERIVDFSDLKLYADKFHGGNVAICCIGTTLSKVKKAEFEYVERDLIVDCANLLRKNGCKEFHLVSGFGSNSDSWFFIPRIKGECENRLIDLEFEQLFIYRPGLLKCERDESRPLEFVARKLSNVVDRNNLWSISTEELSKVIYYVSKYSFKYPNGFHVFEHNEMTKILAEKIRKKSITS